MGASDGRGPGLSRLRGDLDVRHRAATPTTRTTAPTSRVSGPISGPIPRVVVFDGRPPDSVMVSWFDDDARVSNVVGIAPEDPSSTCPATPCGWSTPPGGCAPSTSSARSPTCRPRTGRAGTASPSDGFTQVRLTEPTGSGKQLARISFYTVGEGFLVVSTAGGVASLPLRQDLNVADVVVDGPIDELELRLEGPSDAPRARRCVSSASWSASRRRASGLPRRPVGLRRCRPSCPRRTDRRGSEPWCPGRRAARRRRAAAGACPPGRPGRWRGAP